jgi:MarR family transcriptional regulator, organic hydroperoxide resistance regulator
MADKPMQETIGYMMVQVSRSHRQIVSLALADFGLYIGQEILLMHLWEQDGLSQSQLVERMAVEPPTLTKMLQRLEKSGFVQRRRDSEDARICRAYLTDSGRCLQEPVTRLWNQVEEKILANLTLEEQLLFRRLLLQVRNNLT